MATVGTHTVTATPRGGAAVDVSCWVTDVSVAGGRGDSSGQPDAGSATLEIMTRPILGTLPGALEVGTALDITTTTTTGHRRFTGTITDVALGWDDAGQDTPDAGIGQVVAVGVLADLGRRVVGDVPYPAELDGARVARIMAAAGVTLNPAYSDPGTVQILARDVDSRPALGTAQGTADSAAGIVWSTRGGEVRYADANHRRNIPPSLTLDSCNILITPTWRRTLEGLINVVSVGYGVPVEGSEQPRYTAQQDTSIARYGTFGYSITTELAALADAQAFGSLLLARNATPVWVMADLPVDVASLTAAEYEALLGLDMHALVTLTGLPALGGAPTSAHLWVEGWTEHLAYGVHEFNLVVSGYCRTAPAPRWNDVDPSYTWDTMKPDGVTWDGATCLGPPVSYGRWDDTPATLRWDQIDPAKTWDTYGG